MENLHFDNKKKKMKQNKSLNRIQTFKLEYLVEYRHLIYFIQQLWHLIDQKVLIVFQKHLRQEFSYMNIFLILRSFVPICYRSYTRSFFVQTCKVAVQYDQIINIIINIIVNWFLLFKHLTFKEVSSLCNKKR